MRARELNLISDSVAVKRGSPCRTPERVDNGALSVPFTYERVVVFVKDALTILRKVCGKPNVFITLKRKLLSTPSYAFAQSIDKR